MPPEQRTAHCHHIPEPAASQPTTAHARTMRRTCRRMASVRAAMQPTLMYTSATNT